MHHLLSRLFAGGLSLLGATSPSISTAPTHPVPAVAAAETSVPAVEPAVAAPALVVPAAEVVAKPGVRHDAFRALIESGMMYLPTNFEVAEDGTFDVLLHFHGAPPALEKAVEQNGLNVAVLTVNLGIGSGAYETTYQDPGSLARVLGVLTRHVRKHGGAANAEPRRVALSAWSAGYGAVWKILSRPEQAERVDAVLLSDGLHAGFKPGTWRQVDDLRMQPFAELADRAAKGERLFALTHSGIETYKYASTTETSSYLLKHLGLARSTSGLEETRNMVMTSRADEGSFHLLGFAGGTPDAHCEHLLELGQTLFPLLAARWQRLPAAIFGPPSANP
jgi:hypothetical protein